MAITKKKLIISLLVAISIGLLYWISLPKIIQLPFVEKIDGTVTYSYIREHYAINTQPDPLDATNWGAQKWSINLPFYHTKTLFSFRNIENQPPFVYFKLEIVEDGNKIIRLATESIFRNHTSQKISEYLNQGFHITIYLLTDVSNTTTPLSLFVTMDNRQTKATTYLHISTTYKHYELNQPSDDEFINKAESFVNQFIIKK